MYRALFCSSVTKSDTSLLGTRFASPLVKPFRLKVSVTLAIAREDRLEKAYATQSRATIPRSELPSRSFADNLRTLETVPCSLIPAVASQWNS